MMMDMGLKRINLKMKIAEMKGGGAFALFFAKFKNPASEEHFEYIFECKSTMRVCTMKCMSKVVSDVLGVYDVDCRI
jgi:hypothetical protein